MASSKDLIQQKYNDIRDEFQKLSNKQYKNVRMYTDSYILLKLSEQFYLAPRTIENIVYYRTNFQLSTKESKQIGLFNSL